MFYIFIIVLGFQFSQRSVIWQNSIPQLDENSDGILLQCNLRPCLADDTNLTSALILAPVDIPFQVSRN